MLDALNARDQSFLNNLNRIAARMEAAQRRISTGVRLALPSDAPEQVATLLSARASLAATRQIQSNLGRITAEVDAAEQALQTSGTLLERVRTLATQGANGTQTAASRAAVAQEIGSLLEQIVGLAGTRVEDRYLFSGDADQAAPYTVDLASDPPLSPYQGGAATRLAQHPNGTTFRLARTAQEIFDSPGPGESVFAAIGAIREALLDDDQDAIAAALEGLNPAQAHLSGQLAFYGTTQNKVREAVEFARTLELQLQTRIAGLEEADLSAAVLDLSQSQTQQQAALAARAQIPRSTLFDFLA